jgi:DNA-binding SARP family transcriptional activator
MDFRVLGPLEVVGRDGPLPLGGVKQRSLLAVLLLHANRVVSRDGLIDALWGARPPLTCNKTIQVHISRLRKALGDSRLVTQTPGYALYLEPGELDLARFERLVGDARQAPPELAAAKLREGLELWRGPPLSDLAYEQFAQAEIARLVELRLAALEQRLEADLALGLHADLVGELEGLVSAHPLRERFRYQLMLALYRCERQAEALDAYRAARRELSEELGLEPSDSLRRLEQAILQHDPGLELAGSPSAAPANGASGSGAERALLVVPSRLDELDALLSVARPLAAAVPPRELIAAGVVDAADLAAATEELGRRREPLAAEGVVARTAAFSSPEPGEDIARLAYQEGVDLLLMDAGSEPLGGRAAVVLERAPCDVGLLLRAGGPLGEGPVVVPFGAASHDWAALELGAWITRATGARLRLIGAADRRLDGRDASRLLADASLIVQRTAGVVAEPLLAEPGRDRIAALAEGAGVLVVGLSERWRQRGLGKVRGQIANEPPAPTVFVRRGARPGGLAPAETRTSFSWSLAETSLTH